MNYAYLISILILLVAIIIIFRCNIYKIDRKIQQPMSSVILLGFGVLCILLSFFLIDCVVNNVAPNWHNFLRLYGLFSQTNSVYSVDSNETDAPFYIVISLFGAVLFSGLMISTINNMFNQRIYNVREGHVNYKFKNHVVIIGANSSLLTIINSINLCDRFFLNRADRRDMSQAKIMVVTSKHPQNLSYIRDSVGEDLWSRIFFVNDNILKPVEALPHKCDNTESKNKLTEISKQIKKHFFHSIRIEKALGVYIIGDAELDNNENEVQNTQILNNLINYLNFCAPKNKTSDVIDCYVEYTNPEIIMSSLRSYEDNPYNGILHRLHVNPFDFGLMLASKVWGASKLPDSMFPELEAGKDGICHIDIVGFNAIAAGMLKMAILKCHFGEKASTAITVYHNMEERSQIELFKTNYNLESLTDIHITFVEISSTIEYAGIYRSTHFECGMKYYVVLCDPNLNINIQLSNAMNKTNSETEILLYSKEPVLGGITNNHMGESRKRLSVFGNFNQALDIDSFMDNVMLTYTIHNLTTECIKKDKEPITSILAMSNKQLEDAYRKYAERYYLFSFDNIRWRLISLLESFCNIYSKTDAAIPDHATLLNQQIAAIVLSNYSISQDVDKVLAADDYYRLMTVSTSVFDINKLSTKLQLFKQIKSCHNSRQ